MRLCLVYDCLYPYTVGGAERWYRGLADALRAEGIEVTYVTRRQWPEGEEPDLEGVEVIAVSPSGDLYTPDGRRRVTEPLGFGFGVLVHMLRNRRRYDAVHTCAFPYFSLPAIRLGLAGRRVPVGVDWFEVWSRGYWREYIGRLGGAVGWLVQRLCVALTRQAFVFSELHGRRLAEEGFRGSVTRLSGLYDGPTVTDVTEGERAPLVVFAGRHIHEKRADLVPAVVARARQRLPELRGLILGDGPERPKVLEAIEAAGVEDAVEAPGFVEAERVREAMANATCHLLPSVREGYGLVVIESAAYGTPSVVAAGPDNAAAELLTDGVNGQVAPRAEVDALAEAVLRVHDAGAELRRSTADWFAQNADQLSLARSARSLAAHYGLNSGSHR